MDIPRQLADRSHRSGFGLIAKPRRESNRAHHAQLVFLKSLARIADGANDSAFQILSTADVVENLVLNRIKQQSIDSEVTSLDVCLGAVGITDGIRMATVGISDVAAVGGD